MYKLAVFDVDGTLVSRGERILQKSTLEALRSLQKQGIKIAIASGRPPFAMEKSLLNKIDFDYFVCSNGTYVMDGKHKELYKEEIPKSVVESFMHDFMKHDDALMFQFEDKSYVYHGKKRIANMLHSNLGRLDLLEDDREDRSRHERSLPFAIVCFIAKENLSYYQKKYPDYAIVEFMEDYYDIFPKKCNKASGIRHLCEKTEISMQDVICFGDALNDVEMLRECGFGVAMGDAMQEAKDAADYVTATSDEDGIYHACRNLNLFK